YSAPAMWKPAKSLRVPPQDRELLVSLVQSGRTPQRVALRARIVLGAAEGRSNNGLAQELGITRPTILLWRNRYKQAGIPGLLKDAPRPGRRRKIPVKKVEGILADTSDT